MEKVNASWRIQCNCTCPECGEYIDLLQEQYSCDLPRPLESIDDVNVEVDCPKCNASFIVQDVEY